MENGCWTPNTLCHVEVVEPLIDEKVYYSAIQHPSHVFDWSNWTYEEQACWIECACEVTCWPRADWSPTNQYVRFLNFASLSEESENRLSILKDLLSSLLCIVIFEKVDFRFFVYAIAGILHAYDVDSGFLRNLFHQGLSQRDVLTIRVEVNHDFLWFPLDEKTRNEIFRLVLLQVFLAFLKSLQLIHLMPSIGRLKFLWAIFLTLPLKVCWQIYISYLNIAFKIILLFFLLICFNIILLNEIKIEIQLPMSLCTICCCLWKPLLHAMIIRCIVFTKIFKSFQILLLKLRLLLISCWHVLVIRLKIWVLVSLIFNVTFVSWWCPLEASIVLQATNHNFVQFALSLIMLVSRNGWNVWRAHAEYLFPLGGIELDLIIVTRNFLNLELWYISESLLSLIYLRFVIFLILDVCSVLVVFELLYVEFCAFKF